MMREASASPSVLPRTGNHALRRRRRKGGTWIFPTILGLVLLYLRPNLVSAQLPSAVGVLALERYQESIMLQLAEIWDPTTSVLDSWQKGADCGSWIGVTCDRNGEVVAIILSLFPSVHADLTIMSETLTTGEILDGYLPSIIGELPTLIVLNLNGNNLNGTIPASIGKLVNLKSLDLSRNLLSGVIPSQIGQCTELAILDLHLNRLEKQIPAQIGSLKALILLDLSYNAFDSTIPQEFGNLTELQYMFMGVNDLKGSFPQLGNLTKLEELWIDYCALSSTIPDFPQASLRKIVVRENFLTGPIPLIGSRHLIHLDLSGNYLTGTPVRQAFPQLHVLHLYWNNFSGPMPTNFSASYPELEQLDLSSNRFTGSIPSDLGQLANLTLLKLWDNSLNGSIPSALGDLTNLQVLDISNNFFTGSIPSSFSRLASLQILNLENNDLSGSLSPVQAIIDNDGSSHDGLSSVLLANNSFTGPVLKFDRPFATSVVDLSGNDFCDGTTAGACSAPPLYKRPAVCPTTNCKDNEINLALHSYNGSCICAEPVVMLLMLYSPPFTNFVNQTALRLTRSLANVFELALQQVWVLNYNYTRPVITLDISFYSNATNMLTQSRIKGIESVLSDTRFSLSVFIGPFTRLSASVPSLPNLKVEASPPPPVPAPPTKPSEDALLSPAAIAMVVLGALALAGATGLASYCFCRPKLKKQSSFALRVQEHFVKAIPLQDIRAATDNFGESALLGSGGFGSVYKAVAPDGDLWAVKRTKTVSIAGLAEFQNEVDVISRMSHANLVRLLGYCDEENEQILVYEFVPNGTLKDRLRQPKNDDSWQPLDFRQRLLIALGTAEGLRYLHTFANPTIVHRDVKSENILLDAHWEAKVADFGLLRSNNAMSAGEKAEEDARTKVAGTPGYIDPEYYTTFVVHAKSDVYSYGVVLLELLTGKPALVSDPDADEDEPTITTLACWAVKKLQDSMLTDGKSAIQSLVDPLLTEYPEVETEMIFRLAERCLARHSKHRPEMAEVASHLRVIKARLEGNELENENGCCEIEHDENNYGLEHIGPYGDHSVILGAPVSGVMGGR